MNSTLMPARRGKKDYRLPGLALVVTATLVLGYLVSQMPPPQSYQPSKARMPVTTEPAEDSGTSLYPPDIEGSESVDQAIRVQLGSIHELITEEAFDDALQELDRIRPKVLHLAAALSLVGEALNGKHDYVTARDFFLAAIDRDPTFADAYFGYAQAEEALGNLDAAIGGMRAYLHLQNDPDPYRLKPAQARSAIWEWESRLGRGAWGPTQGIPPGFTEEELKRDGRGAGMKMPIPGTENEKGFLKYEIRHSDKIEMFDR